MKMAQLVLAIEVRQAEDGARRFHLATEQIKNDAAGVTANVSNVQKQIATQFKFTGLDNRATQQIKSQLEMQQAMGDRLFAATHSNLETDLRSHDEYYANLAMGWQNNESMLTLISKTGTVERQRIIENASAQFSQKTMSMIRSVLRVGMYAYAADSLMNMGAEMMKAQRSGESMTIAFIENLPIINRFTSGIKALTYEMSGLAAAEERAKAVGKFTEGANAIIKSMDEQRRLRGLAPEAAKKEQALIDYENRKSAIGDLSGSSLIGQKQQLEAQIQKLQESMSYNLSSSWDPAAESASSVAKLTGLKTELQQVNAEIKIQKTLLAEAGVEYQANLADTSEGLDIVKQRSEITAKMYRDMQNYGDGYYNAQKSLLDMQYQDYDKFIKDKVLLDEWYKNKLHTLQTENSFMGPIEKWAIESQNVWKNLGDAATNSLNNISDAMAEMVMTGKINFKSLADMMIMEILRVAMRAAAANIVGSMTGLFFQIGGALANAFSPKPTQVGGMGPAPPGAAVYAHAGGVIGYDYFPSRYVPSSVFDNAPRLHGGLAFDEYPAILQRGEWVTPANDVRKGKGSSKQNDSTTPVIVIKAWDVSDIQRNSKVIEAIIGNAMKKNTSLRGTFKTYG